MSGLPDLAPILPPLARFALVLALMTAAPVLSRRLHLPDCVGFILVGMLVGPHLLGVLPRSAEVANFLAELGKLLLMFFIGLEIDLRQFVAQRRRAAIFGVLTLGFPLMVGITTGLVFGYGTIAAVLIGSLLASHTLIAFPQVSAAGLASRPAVAVTVGATVLTDVVALLLLATCLAAHRTGFDPLALALQVIELLLFAALLVFGLPRPARWLAAKLGDHQEARFLALLLVVSLSAALAEAMKLEGIIGAFLAGLAVNRALQDGLDAPDRLEFMSRAIFIPAFFVVTGFLVDLVALGRTLLTDLPLVIAIVGGLILAKWLAATVAAWIFGFGAQDRTLMASLTLPQVAATLAAALVGHDAVNAAGERLLDERMLNIVLVLVVVTSVLGPVLTARAVRRMAPAPAPAVAVAGKAA